MNTNQALRYLFGFSIALLLGALAVAHWSTAPNAAFASSAAALAVVGGVAVGIERALELFWTFIGELKGSWWPLNMVGNKVSGTVSSLGTRLRPFYDEANAVVDKLAASDKWAADKLAAAKTELDSLQKTLTEVTTLAPKSERLNLVTASATQAITYVSAKYSDPKLTAAATAAKDVVSELSDFAATFNDNPARRLISIYAGAILGLVVAGCLGLDLFRAALDVQSPVVSSGNFPYWGVAFTGLVMGLGSTPTHEVIKLVQQLKKNSKA